jgi:hypothetical protein
MLSEKARGVAGLGNHNDLSFLNADIQTIAGFEMEGFSDIFGNDNLITFS